MSFLAYPSYKDSGIEWIGPIPSHWDVKRGRHVYRLLNLPTRPEDGVITAFRDGQVTLRENRRTEGFTFAVLEVGYQGVRKGDLVIHGMDAFAGAIGVSESTGKCTPEYAVLEPLSNAAENRYFSKLLRIMAERNFIAVICPSVRERAPRFRFETFKDVHMPVPPRGEQEAIADMLESEIAKIDALVDEQRRMVELLKEKRQAVISHAVTKGLNPHVPLKDSGIPWLGQVPAHWQIKKLGHLCNVQTGARDTEHAVEDGKYPFFVRSQIIERINSKSFDCEAVLTAGDGAGVGKVFHYHVGPFDFHQRVYMMNNFQGICGRFFFHYFRELFYRVALEGGAKSTVDSLRRPMLTGFAICVPPDEEQAAIILEVEKLSSAFDKLTSEAERAITLLQERRTALISAAVTGKIDVRHWQPPASTEQ